MDYGVRLSAVLDFLKDRGKDVRNDPHQLAYVIALVKAFDGKHNSENAVFINARSGTGKTTLATLVGAYAVDHGWVDRIIYVRTEVDVDGAERGALPGDDDEKNKPYQAPFISALNEYQPGLYEKWSQELLGRPAKAVATHPGHFRGITIDNAFIIFDEAQNNSKEVMQTCFTRVTNSCVAVTLGFAGQCDIPEKEREYVSGLLPFEVQALHHEKKGAWLGTLETNYRGDFANWSDDINVTIAELLKEVSEDGENA